MATSLQERTETAVSAYRATQAELQRLSSTLAQLLTQKHENEIVKTEMDVLDSDTIVYKMIGPILVKQDPVEAKNNVEKRLELITREIQRTDDRIKEVSKDSEKKKATIVELQSMMMQQRSEAAKAAAKK
eukprot:TRINITY_DN11624_c0_g1_i1.p1 TRINITY_DN11624_c0_g1~~TRINITY_DN11624_c0_g1_i1.p1  ORF type:complete len:130 (+),score=66.71 TRINITY_DN11624_c0_g1_i1:12-401(+)